MGAGMPLHRFRFLALVGGVCSSLSSQAVGRVQRDPSKSCMDGFQECRCTEPWKDPISGQAEPFGSVGLQRDPSQKGLIPAPGTQLKNMAMFQKLTEN